VLLAMLRNRTSRVVVVNDQQQCAGVVSIKDIVRHYLAGQLGY
jgi:CBS domain-containing protein